MFQYQGRPLSTLIPIERPLKVKEAPTTEASSTLSVWQWRMYQPPTPGTDDLYTQMRSNNWQPVAPDTDQQMQQSMLAMQLYDVLHVPESDGSITVWARGKNLDAVTRIPVILAFGLPADLLTEENRNLLAVEMLQLLPPPQLGELGLVLENGELYAYHVGQLTPQSQELWGELGDALRTLASPGDWHPHTDLTPLCRDDKSYQALASDLTETILSSNKAKQREAKKTLELIHLVRQQVLAVEQGLMKYDWLISFSHIQHMAQELATAYYNLHLQQRALGVLTPAETLPAAVKAPLPKKKRTRTKHTAPIALTAKGSQTMSIRSDLFTQEITRGLLNGDKYVLYPDQKMAVYRISFAKNKGEMVITISPGDEENWGHVLTSLNVLGDEVIDTFLALLAVAIDANGAANITQPFYVNPDDILSTCQRKKSNGAYTPPQRATVIEHLRTLSNAHVQATLIASYKRQGRPVELRAESAILDVLSGKVGEYERLTGEEIWEKRSIKIGDWAKMVPEMGKQTAIMLRQVLKYHSQREQHEKRLGRYLTFQFRVNVQKNEGIVRRTMGVLLEQSGIIPDLKHPARTKERIEDALQRLKDDGVIGNFAEVIEDSPEARAIKQQIEEQAYHWWDLYSRQIWSIEPPDHARESYKLLREGHEK